jgi:hypothetical protein
VRTACPRFFEFSFLSCVDGKSKDYIRACLDDHISTLIHVCWSELVWNLV